MSVVNSRGSMIFLTFYYTGYRSSVVETSTSDITIRRCIDVSIHCIYTSRQGEPVEQSPVPRSTGELKYSSLLRDTAEGESVSIGTRVEVLDAFTSLRWVARCTLGTILPLRPLCYYGITFHRTWDPSRVTHKYNKIFSLSRIFSLHHALFFVSYLLSDFKHDEFLDGKMSILFHFIECL